MFFGPLWALRYYVYQAAEIGQSTIFDFFGYHLQGIVLGYIAGYVEQDLQLLCILGRYDLNTKIDSCCSVLEEQSIKGFLPDLIITFKNFGIIIFSYPRFTDNQTLNIF